MTFKEKLKADKALRGMVEAMETKFNIDHTRMVEFSELCYGYGEHEQRMTNLAAGLLNAEESEKSS